MENEYQNAHKTVTKSFLSLISGLWNEVDKDFSIDDKQLEDIYNNFIAFALPHIFLLFDNKEKRETIMSSVIFHTTSTKKIIYISLRSTSSFVSSL